MTKYQRIFYPSYMTRYRRRYCLFFALCIFVSFIFIILIFFLQNYINFFRIPSEITKEDRLLGSSLRIGGYVEKNSFSFGEKNSIFFRITDFKKSEKVFFCGILPDLFREGQGVVVEGKFAENGTFIASRVLAKHDEKYITKKELPMH